MKGRETFYRRHTVPVTSYSEVKYVLKSLLSSFHWLVFKKINLSVQYQYLTFQPDPDMRGVFKDIVFASMLDYTSFPLILKEMIENF